MNVLAYCGSLEVLLVSRNKQPWKGFLNLPGGKIEGSESVEDAAKRELFEETGLKSLYFPIKTMGKVVDVLEEPNSIIYCVRVYVDRDAKIFTNETQKVGWYKWQEIRDSRLLVPNLKVIIPLMWNEVVDWTIKDKQPLTEFLDHQFSIKIQGVE